MLSEMQNLILQQRDIKLTIDKLNSKIEDLEYRYKTLEEENINLTNELYRLENSLDARIDILWLEWNNVRSSE